MSKSPIAFADHSECVAMTAMAGTASADVGRRRVLRPRQDLWLSEAPFDRVYRLETGRLALIAADADGRELPVGAVGPGEWFGEYCFCDARNAPHGAVFARAEEECRLVEVTSAAWIRHLAASESAVRDLLTTTCRRMARAERRLVMLARRNADERVALLLLELATLAGETAAAQTTPVTLTHAEIASATALSRAHVSVTLGQLRRRGLIHYRRGRAITINLTKLRAFADEIEQRGADDEGE